MKKQSFLYSLRHALSGIMAALVHERNFQWQLIIFLLVLLVVQFLNWSIERMALVILVGFAVLSLELINTSLEELEDVLHPDHHGAIKRSKDMAAGAVLLMSLAAVVIGLLFIKG